MATVTLLSPLLLTTAAVKVFILLSCIFDFPSQQAPAIQLSFALAHYGLNPGNITPYVSNSLRILKLFRHRLGAEIEQVPLEFLEFALKLIQTHFSVMLRLH
jgi:hypothetical protein